MPTDSTSRPLGGSAGHEVKRRKRQKLRAIHFMTLGNVEAILLQSRFEQKLVKIPNPFLPSSKTPL
jgi:hypothetical protein